MGSQACTSQVRCAADPVAQLAVMQSFRGGQSTVVRFDRILLTVATKSWREGLEHCLHQSSAHTSSMLRCRSTSAAAVMQRFRGDSLQWNIPLCACRGFVSQISKHSRAAHVSTARKACYFCSFSE